VKRIIAALLLIATTSLHAEQKTPPPPAAARATEWPKITERKLDNGLTVVLVPLHNVPKVTALLTFMSGNGSVAQLAARAATEGTATRTSRQLREALRAIGGSIAVTTDADATTFSSEALSEFAPRLFELLADSAQHPAFPKSEVELAKTNLAQEIAEQRSSPDFLVDERMRKALFGSHPYSFVTAEPETIAKLTREQLVSFAATRYVPNDAHLIVVGDINVERTFAEVKKAFGEWTKVERVAGVQPAFGKREKRQIYFVDRPDSVQSTIRIAAIAPPRKSADYIPLRIASTILGGSFYSRLNRNIREAKGYSYSPYSTAELQRRAGAFFVEAAVRNEVTGATILELLYELDRMRVDAVTDEELTSAKRYTIGSTQVELETQAGLANRIATIYTYDLPHDFLETFRGHVEAITADVVRKTAAKYFDTYRGAIVVVGDWSKVKEQVEPFGDVTVVK